jgi:hypothetical protein
MTEQEQREIARRILEALYDTWERHTDLSLNTVQEQGGWEKSVFRTVVDRLEKQQGLIRGAGSSYSFEITPDGITRAEESGIIPNEKVEWHRNIRQHILAFLADLYDREGSRAHEHYEKIANGAAVNNRMEILRDLSYLIDIGDVEAASTSSFRITDKGLRSYKGSDFEDLI